MALILDLATRNEFKQVALLKELYRFLVYEQKLERFMVRQKLQSLIKISDDRNNATHVSKAFTLEEAINHQELVYSLIKEIRPTAIQSA